MDPNPNEDAHNKEKNFKFITSEFTKIRHFEITKPKKFVPRLLPQLGVFLVGRVNIPSHTLPTSALRPPNFELALTPLGVRSTRDRALCRLAAGDGGDIDYKQRLSYTAHLHTCDSC